MITLSRQEDALYTKLVEEYNKNGYYKLCSLHSFLKSKYENEKNPDKAAMYYQIWWYAEEDY